MARARPKKGLEATLRSLETFTKQDRRIVLRNILTRTEGQMLSIWPLLGPRLHDFLKGESEYNFIEKDRSITLEYSQEKLSRITTLLACASPKLCAAGAGSCNAHGRSIDCPGIATRSEIKSAIMPLVEYDADGTLIVQDNETYRRAAEITSNQIDKVIEIIENSSATARTIVNTCPPEIQDRVLKSLDLAVKADASCNFQISAPLIASVMKSLDLQASMGAGLQLLDLWKCDTAVHCGICERKRESALIIAKERLDTSRQEFYDCMHTAERYLLILREQFMQVTRHIQSVHSLSSEINRILPKDAIRADAKLLLPSDFDSTFLGVKKRTSRSKPGSLANLSIQLPLTVKIPFIDTSREVFIENLPPQIEQFHLEERFSVLGPIEAIDVYEVPLDSTHPDDTINKKKKKQDSARPIRPPFSKTCAFIRFATADSATKALQPSLRIFGLALHEYECRTRPATDLFSIFLTNLRPDLHEDRLAINIAHILNIDPHHDILVWRRDPFEKPDRAKIRFSSHAEARWVYHKFQDALEHPSPSSGTKKKKSKAEQEFEDNVPFSISWSPPHGALPASISPNID